MKMTKKFALIGSKLSHSWSPIIHNTIFENLNIDCSYELIECEENELENIVNLLKNGELNGFNVTIPYKKTIMKYLDKIEGNAQKIGSVNTVSLVDGKVVGYNTDYLGFKEELKYYKIDTINKNAYILGTGGASLAVKQALLDLGANVYLVSRNPKNDEISYEELSNRNIDILVNTTPVGMYPNVDESPIDKSICEKCKCVIDIIFNPLYTKLLLTASSKYNGLFMLIGQAIEAEKIWHNREILLNIEEIMGNIIKLKNL